MTRTWKDTPQGERRLWERVWRCAFRWPRSGGWFWKRQLSKARRKAWRNPGHWRGLLHWESECNWKRW
jgi:hypothetical protein